MTEVEKSEIRRLAEEGLNAHQIALRVGRAVNTIHAALARMGIVARSGDGAGGKLRDYTLPHLDDDDLAGLTNRQRREREVAAMRAFLLKTELELTLTTAREVLRRTDADLRRDLDIDAVQARALRRAARRFRRRLVLAALDEKGNCL